VPEYDASLERVLCPGASEDLVGAVDARAGEMLELGRRLFERFLDVVVRAPSRNATRLEV